MKRGGKTSERKNIGRTLGAQIATYRRLRKLTQNELAERLNVETETISRFERGSTLPSLARLAELADTLDVGLAELVGGASPLSGDQAREVVDCLAKVNSADRALVVDIVKRLTTRLASFQWSPPARAPAGVERREELVPAEERRAKYRVPGKPRAK